MKYSAFDYNQILGREKEYVYFKKNKIAGGYITYVFVGDIDRLPDET